MINRNSLLSRKSKESILRVFNAYEKMKDKNIVPYGKGVPRGIGISSPLSEVYMQDLDKTIKERQEVVFYTRYVDDIFIILSDLGKYKTIQDYYQGLVGLFTGYDLTLQEDGSDKCKLIDLYKPTNGRTINEEVTYLVTIFKIDDKFIYSRSHFRR